MSLEDKTETLKNMVSVESHRLDSDLNFTPNPALISQGWERRFVSYGQRMQEAIDLYQELDFEVHLEPLRQEELLEACGDCQALAILELKTLYTRKTR